MEYSRSLQINQVLSTLSTTKQFHDDGIYWDVQVRVGEKIFNCQRSILAANSEYFHTKFNGNNSEESNATSQEPITLPYQDVKSFEIILSFMYTGEIHVTDFDVLQLLKLSDFLRLRTDYFKELMVEYLSDLSRETEPMMGALDLLQYAYKKKENVLVDVMSAHVCRHLYYLSEVAQLMQISSGLLNALLERSKNYIVPLRGSADILVKIVHNWVNYSRKTRSQYRHKLMENVDFANVSSEFTQSYVNRLEDAVDEVLDLTGEVKSLSELKTLGVALEVDHIGGVGLWKIISLKVPRLSELPQEGAVMLFSQFYMISNLLWRIWLERSTSDYIDVYLCCDGTDLASEWNCYARAMFRIVNSQKGENFCGNMNFGLFRSCDPEPRGQGLKSFMPWNELVDPEKGYIASDGSITLQACVHAEVPFLAYNPHNPP